MAAPGTYANPSHKPCWETCSSCFRCKNKGCGGPGHSWSPSRCAGCSGRHDPFGYIDEDDRDYCDCNNGVLRWKTQNGRIVVSKIPRNPFAGQVKQERNTEDERDWNSYLNDMREKLNNPTWDPVQVTETDDPFSTHFKVLDPKDYR